MKKNSKPKRCPRCGTILEVVTNDKGVKFLVCPTGNFATTEDDFNSCSDEEMLGGKLGLDPFDV